MILNFAALYVVGQGVVRRNVVGLSIPNAKALGFNVSSLRVVSVSIS